VERGGGEKRKKTGLGRAGQFQNDRFAEKTGTCCDQDANGPVMNDQLGRTDKKTEIGARQRKQKTWTAFAQENVKK